MSYHEKRRHWKNEMKKRLRGTKIPPRPLSKPILVRQPTNTNNKDNNRYYVTYSPQNKVYQVSRRPPLNLNSTKKDLPDSIGENVLLSSVSIPEPSKSEENESLEDVSIEIEPLPTIRQGLNQSITKTKLSTITEATRTIKPTLPNKSPPVVIIQLTDTIPLNHTYNEIVHVVSNKEELKPSTIKHIIHLDDYEEDFEEEPIFDEEIQQIKGTTSPSLLSTTIRNSFRNNNYN